MKILFCGEKQRAVAGIIIFFHAAQLNRSNLKGFLLIYRARGNTSASGNNCLPENRDTKNAPKPGCFKT
jgi:hypothetical protein